MLERVEGSTQDRMEFLKKEFEKKEGQLRQELKSYELQAKVAND
jgi:hypothetical protein